jgi:hypothetical protein
MNDQSEHEYDSIDYCINFWEGAQEDIDEIICDLCPPQHIRAFDDVA